MICLGIDSSLNFKVLGIVIGDIGIIRGINDKLIKAIREPSIHVSKLKRSKKKKLINYFYELHNRGELKEIKLISLDFDLLSEARKISKKNRTPTTKALFIVIYRILREIISGAQPIDLLDLDSEFVVIENNLRRYFSRITYRGPCSALADIVAYINARKLDRPPIEVITQI